MKYAWLARTFERLSLTTSMSKVIVRELRDGEEVILRGVFYSSVHDLAATHYTAHQLSAWAPRDFDAQSWKARMRSRRTLERVTSTPQRSQTTPL